MFEINKFIEDFFVYPKPCHVDEWKKVFNDMAVHTRKKLPSELLLKRRPNEEENIYQYRLANYEPITYGSMNKAFDSLYRMFSNINYSIKGSKELMDYLETKSFYGYDFKTWMQKQILKFDIEDPNGFIVWYPTGEGLINDGVKVIPKPLLVNSFNLHYADENVFSFLSNEKSKIINDNGEEEMSGDVYWIFTATEFYKLIQIGSSKKKDFQTIFIYKHGIQNIPVVIVGGDINADGFYESFFAPYLAFGNEAIRQFSDWQAIMTTSSFPFIEDFAVDCELMPDYRKSNNIPDGEEKYPNEPDAAKLQPIPTTPYGVRLRRIPAGTTQMDQVLDVNVPSRRFISPDIGIARYSGESWEKLIEKAEDSLHLTLVGTNQSGVAKEMDNEDKYSMITKIMNNFFDNIMQNSLYFMERYINPIEKNQVAVVKPTSMKVKTEADIVSEIGTLKEKKVPALFMSEATRELSKKRFAGDPVTEKVFEMISMIDPLYIYDTNERNQLVLSGTVDKSFAQKSVFVHPLLMQMVSEMGNEAFLKADPSIIKDKFEEMVAPYIVVQQPMVDPNGNITP